MSDQNKISFSLRKLLFVPAIFAIYFALFHKEAAVFSFIAATGSSVLLFLVKKENLSSFVLSIAGCLLGGFAALSITSSFNGSGPMSEELVKITVGVVCGYLLMKLLVVFEKVFDKLEDKEQDRNSVDTVEIESFLSKK